MTRSRFDRIRAYLQIAAFASVLLQCAMLLAIAAGYIPEDAFRLPVFQVCAAAFVIGLSIVVKAIACRAFDASVARGDLFIFWGAEPTLLFRHKREGTILVALHWRLMSKTDLNKASSQIMAMR